MRLESDYTLCFILEMLKLHGAENGTFLIRNHQKKKRFFVISLIWKKKSHHFIIEKQVLFLTISFLRIDTEQSDILNRF